MNSNNDATVKSLSSTLKDAGFNWTHGTPGTLGTPGTACTADVLWTKPMSCQSLLDVYAQLNRNTISSVHGSSSISTTSFTTGFNGFSDDNFQAASPSVKSALTRRSTDTPLTTFHFCDDSTADRLFSNSSQTRNENRNNNEIFFVRDSSAETLTPSYSSVSPTQQLKPDSTSTCFCSVETPTNCPDVTGPTSSALPAAVDDVQSTNHSSESVDVTVSTSNSNNNSSPDTSYAETSLTSFDDVTLRRQSVVREVVFSVLRNIGCYGLLAAILTIAGEGHVFSDHVVADANRIVLLVLIFIGLTAAISQFVHGCREMSSRSARRTWLMNMLSEPTNKSQFEQLMRSRRSSAPFIGLQLHRLQTLSTICCSHATGPSRVLQILPYKSWSDCSPSTDSSLTWTPFDSSPRWIVVSKDYRMVGERTRRAVAAAVEDFKTKSSFSPRRMQFSFVLDVQQGDDFPDTAAVLVFPDEDATRPKRRRCQYSTLCYLATVCLCVDALFAVCFYCRTPHAGTCTVSKRFEN